MGNQYKIGRSYEYKIANFLKKNDYIVVRSSASHTTYDLVAVSKSQVRLIQVKSSWSVPKYFYTSIDEDGEIVGAGRNWLMKTFEEVKKMLYNCTKYKNVSHELWLGDKKRNRVIVIEAKYSYGQSILFVKSIYGRGWKLLERERWLK